MGGLSCTEGYMGCTVWQAVDQVHWKCATDYVGVKTLWLGTYANSACRLSQALLYWLLSVFYLCVQGLLVSRGFRKFASQELGYGNHLVLQMQT